MKYITPENQKIEVENTQFNHNFDLEDWDIEALFKDTVWLEFIDEGKDEMQTRGGIHIPYNARSLKDFYRVGRVLKTGPDCSESVEEGCYVIVPPNLGMKGMKTGPNGGPSLFVREELIMAVIAPKDDNAVERKGRYE